MARLITIRKFTTKKLYLTLLHSVSGWIEHKILLALFMWWLHIVMLAVYILKSLFLYLPKGGTTLFYTSLFIGVQLCRLSNSLFRRYLSTLTLRAIKMAHFQREQLLHFPSFFFSVSTILLPIICSLPPPKKALKNTFMSVIIISFF